jgi:hypothetical protein
VPAGAGLSGTRAGRARTGRGHCAVRSRTRASARGEGRTIMEAGMVEREGGDLILDSASLPRQADAAPDSNAPPKPPLPPIFQCTDSQGGGYLHEYEAAPGAAN